MGRPGKTNAPPEKRVENGKNRGKGILGFLLIFIFAALLGPLIILFLEDLTEFFL